MKYGKNGVQFRQKFHDTSYILDKISLRVAILRTSLNRYREGVETSSGERKELMQVGNVKGELMPTIQVFTFEKSYYNAAGTVKWRKMSGPTCDKKIRYKMKLGLHRLVVMPAVLHGTETWAEMDT